MCLFGTTRTVVYETKSSSHILLNMNQASPMQIILYPFSLFIWQKVSQTQMLTAYVFKKQISEKAAEDQENNGFRMSKLK